MRHVGSETMSVIERVILAVFDMFHRLIVYLIIFCIEPFVV